MKKSIKIIRNTLISLLILPITYGLISLGLTYTTVNPKEIYNKTKTVYLSSNGIHLDFIIPIDEVNEQLKKELTSIDSYSFLAFGWGDKNFYLNTKTWDDLKIANVFNALFMKSSTLIHVTKYRTKHNDWIPIKLSGTQLNLLNNYISQSFKLDEKGNKKYLPDAYGNNDNFYQANGSYSCLNTCNSWINNGLRYAGLNSCLWTPYSFRIIDIHR